MFLVFLVKDLVQVTDESAKVDADKIRNRNKLTSSRAKVKIKPCSWSKIYTSHMLSANNQISSLYNFLAG